MVPWDYLFNFLDNTQEFFSPLSIVPQYLLHCEYYDAIFILFFHVAFATLMGMAFVFFNVFLGHS